MTSEQLYKLVCNLTPEEKKKISRGLGLSKLTSLPAFIILYKRLIDCPGWTKESEIKVRGDLFKSPVKYHQARELLLDKIVRILSFAEESTPSQSYILKAVELKAIDLAQKSVYRVFNSYLENGNFFEAHSLVHLEYRIWDSYRIRLFTEEAQPSIKLVEEAFKTENELKEIANEISAIGKLQMADWGTSGKHFLERLSKLNTFHSRQELAIERLKSRAHFLCGDTTTAIRIQRQLLNMDFSHEIGQGLWIREVGLLIQLLCDELLEEEACEWTFRLSSLNTNSAIEEEVRQRTLIMNGMAVAERFWRFDLCESVLKDLTPNKTLFNAFTESILFYNGAMVAFGNQRYSLALEYLERIARIPKKDRMNLLWQPFILKAFIFHHLGDDISASWRAAKRQIDKTSLQFPRRLLQMLKRINNDPQSINPFEREKWIEVFNQECISPEEIEARIYFNVDLWLGSLVKRIPMAEFAKTTQKEGFNSKDRRVGT